MSNILFVTFEYVINNVTFTRNRLMSKSDVRRYAAITDANILGYQKAERVGVVEVDDMYECPIFGDVYRLEDGRLVLEDGSALSSWQMRNITSINLADEEEIII